MPRKKSAGASGSVKIRAAKPADDDAPELTDDFFDRAEVRDGDRIIRRGRPPVAGGKEAVKLRIDKDVLGRFRESGPGWQSRINDILRKASLRGVKSEAASPKRKRA